MPAIMEQMEKKSFSAPDKNRSMPKTSIDFVTVNDTTFARITLQPGWKWSECVKPTAGGELCQSSHLQYHVSGRLHIEMEDGAAEEFKAGDVSFIPPGHDAWVIGNEPVVVVDVTGLHDYGIAHENH